MWISLPLVALTFVPESFAIMQSGDQEEAQYRTSAITISIIAYGLFNCFAWAIGRWAARASARLDASEERRKADIAAERLQAEQAVADERLRLARELHDIVAHAVTIMIIHSATASRLIHRDPSAAEEALDIVHLAGQQAVDELHRMLGLLRAVGSSAGLDADLPTLSDLPALVERTRAGGLKVELTGSGQPTSLDPSVQLAGYRVVQETLTNALKYSGVGSRTTVDLGWTDQKLIITVQDDGKGLVSDGVVLPSNGRGLIGLRERVSIAGGSLTAGPTEGGGFLVSAELPTSNDRAHRSSNASG
jgi:signal transduction histidine kinase